MTSIDIVIEALFLLHPEGTPREPTEDHVSSAEHGKKDKKKKEMANEEEDIDALLAEFGVDAQRVAGLLLDAIAKADAFA